MLQVSIVRRQSDHSRAAGLSWLPEIIRKQENKGEFRF